MAKVKNKFIPEIPNSLRFEVLDQSSLTVPLDCSVPETTEQMINRILNQRLQNVTNGEADFEDDPLDFSLEDDEMDLIPDDFFNDDDDRPEAEQDGSARGADEPEAPTPAPIEPEPESNPETEVAKSPT